MRVLMMLVSTLMLAACPAAEEPQDVEPGMSEAVSTPTPEDVRIRINVDQNGQTVEVPVNERFAIELVGVPTAGYVWQPATIPAFVTRVSEASGNTTAAQSQPGFTGGNHWEVTIFAATAAGTGEIVMEQKRPWETDEPANQTFRVTIVAR
jgi:inhibitor of cysteine peptidase